MTFIDLMKKFPTEESVIEYYVKIRYPYGVHCNHCGSIRVYHRTNRPKVFNCPDCNNTFSPFKGTILMDISKAIGVAWEKWNDICINGKNTKFNGGCESRIYV